MFSDTFVFVIGTDMCINRWKHFHNDLTMLSYYFLKLGTFDDIANSAIVNLDLQWFCIFTPLLFFSIQKKIHNTSELKQRLIEPLNAPEWHETLFQLHSVTRTQDASTMDLRGSTDIGPPIIFTPRSW